MKLPGNELAKIFRRFGFKYNTTCYCKETVERMNREGVEWCRANEEWIVKRALKEAYKRRIFIPASIQRAFILRCLRAALRRCNS